MTRALVVLLLVLSAGCSRLSEVGKAPSFTPLEGSYQHHALYSVPLPMTQDRQRASDSASLWSSGHRSLLGDRRAGQRGDILTVVIQIDDRAEMTNTSDRTRAASGNMSIPSLMGIPQRVDQHLPEGASMADAVDASSASSYRGNGSIRRRETLTLRIAATVVERLANGVLRVEGAQEVRVNHELRELVVSGYVRPEDISRQNEITYDKIAGARIAYGGRGLISDVQQPRYGQQIADILLPY
ncbi:flagellar basal body L-ring protein FlgH [Halodurantibacterium flavum]|uniref:Flagellar L-ring protein n=1 Tax=Halodurantibacterium flavum TaxID=1382802 RepID=A0ABW4S920_9RHOB